MHANIGRQVIDKHEVYSSITELWISGKAMGRENMVVQSVVHLCGVPLETEKIRVSFERCSIKGTLSQTGHCTSEKCYVGTCYLFELILSLPPRVHSM